MFCKFCGEKISENTLLCPYCGKMQTASENEPNVNAAESSVETNVKKVISDKNKAILEKCCFGSIIGGIVGLCIFLVIVLVGLIVYGKVYLFDGYDFTAVLSVISIVLMMVGLCGVIAKFVLYFVFKIGNLPTNMKKRVLVVACLSFSIWGFADCSNSNSAVISTGWSFYTIYSECNCEYPWADCGADYLSVDTNPYDYDSDSYSATIYMSDALSAIRSINSKLGLPSYLYNEMMETRALDGRQTYSSAKVSVAWRYHPDSGLEVRYTKNY